MQGKLYHDVFEIDGHDLELIRIIGFVTTVEIIVDQDYSQRTYRFEYDVKGCLRGDYNKHNVDHLNKVIQNCTGIVSATIKGGEPPGMIIHGVLSGIEFIDERKYEKTI